MNPRAYTVRDTPEIESRIESDLETVVETVHEGDPNLESLVLTGGFARGEGTVIDGEPQNDYDFVAVRSLGRTRTGYDEMTTELEHELGLHIDLAPVQAWRLPFVSRSIFWYETALRGRVLTGDDPLPRIPIQDPDDIDETEGLRLLVNRAAGLLLATRKQDPHEHRIQASKGLLAALDAHLLGAGAFPPSQTERWERFRALEQEGNAPRPLEAAKPWLAWAYGFKMHPAEHQDKNARDAWNAAARSILDAVPAALDHAGFDSLDAYEKDDGIADHVHYLLNASSVPQAPRLVQNPTGRVRAATLRILDASRDATVDARPAKRHLRPFRPDGTPPLDLLEKLRSATLQ